MNCRRVETGGRKVNYDSMGKEGNRISNVLDEEKVRYRRQIK